MAPVKKAVPLNLIKKMIDEDVPVKQIAKRLKVSEKTIKRRLVDNGIRIRSKYFCEKEAIEQIVADAVKSNQYRGVTTLEGMMRAIKLRVPRHRVFNALKGVTTDRKVGHNRLKRRCYWVRSPLSMIHVDGNHKLIRWRFVIHGGIDGFSRKIFFLGISSNNKASTVLSHFEKGVAKMGLPSRIRCDKGKENTGIIRYMLHYRGPGRNSAIAGRSVHNTRVERLWVDVFRRFTHVYHGIFGDLEINGILEPSSDLDIYCLHMVFSPVLQKALDGFTAMWDNHRLRTCKSKTPNELYKTGLEGISTLSRQYGVIPTELKQKGIVDGSLNTHYSDDEGGIEVPPTLSPFENEEVHQRLKEFFMKTSVTIENAVGWYISLRNELQSIFE